MVYVLIVLWLIALVLFITNPKSESTRWAALTAFAGGGGGLSRTMTETVIPYLHNYHLSNEHIDAVLMKVHMYGSFMNHTGLPYALLMFALCHSEMFSSRSRRIVAVILSIPIVITYFITPMKTDIELSFKLLFIWCVPYLLFACGLLVYSYIKEKNPYNKKTRLTTLFIVLPPALFQVIANYTFKAFGVFEQFWRVMPLVITILFVFILVFSIKNGALGIRLKFEQHRLDSTMRALTSGASILNHTIKNEVLKISMCTSNIVSQTDSVNEEVMQNLEIINDATNHMMAMVGRIQESMQDIVLKEERHNLGELVDTSLANLGPFIDKKEIHVRRLYPYHIHVQCDRVHLIEVLSNIIKNAVEAMGQNGTLAIELYEHKKQVVLSIKDNGAGISKTNLAHVLDPFFSTKNRSLNFGLGLSYCYNVMQKSGGSLKVESEENVGTTLFLEFSIKKVFMDEVMTTPAKADGVYG